MSTHTVLLCSPVSPYDIYKELLNRGDKSSGDLVFHLRGNHVYQTFSVLYLPRSALIRDLLAKSRCQCSAELCEAKSPTLHISLPYVLIAELLELEDLVVLGTVNSHTAFEGNVSWIMQALHFDQVINEHSITWPSEEHARKDLVSIPMTVPLRFS